MTEELVKRGRGRPRKTAEDKERIQFIKDPKKNESEVKIGFILCTRFSFKDSNTPILCHNAYPARHDHVDDKGNPKPGQFRCPDLNSCLVRWSRAKENIEYQNKIQKKV